MNSPILSSKELVDLAYKEVDVLQSIIARHEGHAMRVRGWFVLVAGALMAAKYANNIEIDIVTLFLLCLVTSLFFLLWEHHYWALAHRAILRIAFIENIVNDAIESGSNHYHGTRISYTMAGKDVRGLLIGFQFEAPYDSARSWSYLGWMTDFRGFLSRPWNATYFFGMTAFSFFVRFG